MSLRSVPRLIAFDLDGTVWSPDMYMLWGGGAPFKAGPDGGVSTLIDKAGETVRLLGVCGSIFHDLKYDDTFSETICAIVSCTDEPTWANECLQKFKTTPGKEPLLHSVHSSQIYKANKQKHFKALQNQYPDIPFCEMMFFDNEMHNITTVQKLGIHAIYCPNGMTEEVWMGALQEYSALGNN